MRVDFALIFRDFDRVSCSGVRLAFDFLTLVIGLLGVLD